jgi:mono/diheme cytochrome c family protein
MKTAGPLAIALALGLAGCDRADMVSQGKASTWDKSAFFPDHRSMRAPAPGTLARGAPNQPVPEPATITRAMLTRGQERYDIFCTPCHGLAGQGDGMIVRRGFPKPPSFTSDALMAMKASDFYDVITKGHGAMYSYADRVPPADRWAIAAYIRALQQSQRPILAALPAEDQAKLKEPTP